MFAIVSGMLFVTVSLLEVLFFRSAGSGGPLVFSVIHNFFHWIFGALGLLASRSTSRIHLLYARTAGLLFIVLSLVGFIMPRAFSASIGVELNVLYALWYLGLGLWGVGVGFARLKQ